MNEGRRKGLWSNSPINVDGALETYDKSIEINPNDGVLWYNKGLALANLGRADEAVPCYDKAIELNPDFIDIDCLRRYYLKIETNVEDKLTVTIMDYDEYDPSEYDFSTVFIDFYRPRMDKNNDDLIHGYSFPQQEEWSIKPHEVTMELVKSELEEKPSLLKIKVYQSYGDLMINEIDSRRLKKYFQENFATGPKWE